MIKGIHHIGLIVRDLDVSEKFYRNILGAKLLYRSGAEEKDVAKEVGVEGAHTKLSVLKLGTSTIELVEYIEPKIDIGTVSAAAIGTIHAAFEVDDIDRIVQKLKEEGIVFNAAPKEITEGENAGWVWIYFRDPDGSQLEFVENRNLKVEL